MSDSALAPGTVLRSPKREYTICRVLGQGGFGITYLVETPFKMDNISFKGKFAVKEHFLSMLCAREPGTSNIHFLPNSTEEVQRSQKAFVAEAQRLQKLGINHRNIVEVSEVFEYNKTAYYVMEYIDGGSLADYVKAHGGRLSWEETAKLMRPICEAVAMLHTNQVAHYDIKPQNIMIQQDMAGLRPVLIDFGLAKHYDGQGQATSSIAAAGYTPGYAPVEQYTGIQEFSPTADVYALAATLCYCLTGHAPAKADKLDLDALCDELLSLGVSDAVANVLLRSMEYRPKARPADAGALAAALFAGTPPATVRRRQPPRQQPTVVQPAPAPVSPAVQSPAKVSEDAPKPARPRRRWLVPAVATAVIALLITGLLFFNGGYSADQDYLDSIAKADSIARAQSVAPYRTNPQNLDLQVTLDGTKYYFSQSEWNNLSRSVRRKCSTQGVVIDYDGQRFVTALNMERHGSGYKYSDEIGFTWDEAKQWISNKGDGWRLPNEDEGYAMFDQCEAVCEAIKAFGGDEDPVWKYWTSTEKDASSAERFELSIGFTESEDPTNKSNAYCVRAVREI